MENGTGIDTIYVSKDGKQLWLPGANEPIASINFQYPWVLTNTELGSASISDIMLSIPTEHCTVVYEEYYYVYIEGKNGYIAYVRDTSKTPTTEPLTEVFEVPVVE